MARSQLRFMSCPPSPIPRIRYLPHVHGILLDHLPSCQAPNIRALMTFHGPREKSSRVIQTYVRYSTCLRTCEVPEYKRLSTFLDNSQDAAIYVVPRVRVTRYVCGPINNLNPLIAHTRGIVHEAGRWVEEAKEQHSRLRVMIVDNSLEHKQTGLGYRRLKKDDGMGCPREIRDESRKHGRHYLSR